VKIIFLDIDGVLNVAPKEWDKYGAVFHPSLVSNLKSIIDSTGAKIVISSSWRTDGLDKMQSMWCGRNLPGEVIDVTPDLSRIDKFGSLEYYVSVERGYEIEKWLAKHPEVTNYVIIDDGKDMLPNQMDNYINTETNEIDSIYSYGLTKNCALKAIKILNK
jgi:hypothetical protein